ncbi:hypothetical protein ACLKA6_008083 [Drosophila palustris]
MTESKVCTAGHSYKYKHKAEQGEQDEQALALIIRLVSQSLHCSCSMQRDTQKPKSTRTMSPLRSTSLATRDEQQTEELCP